MAPAVVRYAAGVSPLERWVPRSSRRTRLLLAAVMWTAVGLGLCVAGLHWLLAAPVRWRAAGLAAAVLAGWVKGRWVLLPRAEANGQRILDSGEGRCIGGVFTWGSWLLVAVMMTGGILLRHSAIPRPWLGLLYLAIGNALVAASPGCWRRWHRLGGR